MMSIIIKELAKKLTSYINENGGEIFVDATWVNNWLEKNDGPFITQIVDKDNNPIEGAKVSIVNKK